MYMEVIYLQCESQYKPNLYFDYEVKDFQFTGNYFCDGNCDLIHNVFPQFAAVLMICD